MTDALFEKYADELWNLATYPEDWDVRIVFNTVLRQAMLLSKEGE